MKKAGRLFVIAGIAVLLFQGTILLAFEPGEKGEALPLRYKKWLEEEVVYIITPVEKEVFLKLNTDRERDLFIEAFWRHRDPNPSTSENEFKTEHYRRISYANRYFGRGEGKPGWMTDRGRIYIILGEPNDIQRFEGKSQIYPAEIWFYQGKTDMGLPAGFHIVFFQKGGIGEYILYSPARDGPQALMTSYYGDPIDYMSAYEQLREIEPTLAQVSLSLIPGEESTAIGRPSLSSDLLIQRVESLPTRMVEEKYARKFLQYKDIVEVEYTANYIDNDSLVRVLRDDSGLYFVHYLIEPQRLSVNQFENKYYTTLRLNGTVVNLEGKTIFQFEKTISLEFDEEKMRSISRQPLSIHDMFPLVPGDYKLSVLVKNEVSKEFTSMEWNISVPEDPNSLLLSPLILGYKLSEVEAQKKRLKPFEVRGHQIYAQPNRVFLSKDTMGIFFQISGVNDELRQKGELRFIFTREEKEYRSFTKKIGEYPELPSVIQLFPLADFQPAHYRIKVSLLVDGKEMAAGSEEFDITYLEAVARPWVYARILPGVDDPAIDYMLGIQFFNTGKMEEARSHLERAYQKNPQSFDFALSLARLWMTYGEPARVENLLLPFVRTDETPKYEVLFLLGKAYQATGQLARAIEMFDQAVSHYGVNTSLLNVIGECYWQMGKPKEALVVWEKSLEIDPNQPQIKKSVEAIKEKK